MLRRARSVLVVSFLGIL